MQLCYDFEVFYRALALTAGVDRGICRSQLRAPQRGGHTVKNNPRAKTRINQGVTDE
jgi:hypothetical protein